MEILYKQTKIYYEIFGEGEPILFLHGWGCDLTFFKSVALELEGKKILIDFPPFGKSGRLISPFNLYDYVNLCVEVLKQNGIEKINIVCHSFGCRVAIILANLGYVNKLIITSGAGIKDKSISTTYKIIKFKMLKKLVKYRILNAKSLEKYGSSDYKVLDNVTKKTFCLITQKDLKKEIKKIQNHTLLIYGKQDKITPVKFGKYMFKHIKNSGLFIYENGDHFAYLNNLTSFTRAVKEFLRS